MKCPDCGEKLKRYPCGWGNPNDIGSCRSGERKEPLETKYHVNCGSVNLL